MSESTGETAARSRAERLLHELRMQVLAARATAQELQVPLSQLQPELLFEQGRVRGVIDQLTLVSRTARQILKSLKTEPGEVEDG